MISGFHQREAPARTRPAPPPARRSRRTRRRRGPARCRPGRRRPRRCRARTSSAASVQNAEIDGLVAARAPSSGANAARSRVANGGLAIATVQSIAWGAVAGAHAPLGLGQQSSTSAPGAGRSDNDSVARVGMTLNAMPPSSAATLRQMPWKPGGPVRACAIPMSSSATAARASIAIGLAMPSTRDEWPPGPSSVTVAAPMPRWRDADAARRSARRRSRVDAARAARCRETRGCSCRRAPRRPRTARRLGRGPARASASRIAAIAPLVSAVPRPWSRLVRRGRCAAAWSARSSRGRCRRERSAAGAGAVSAEARVHVGVRARVCRPSSTSTAPRPARAAPPPAAAPAAARVRSGSGCRTTPARRAVRPGLHRQRRSSPRERSRNGVSRVGGASHAPPADVVQARARRERCVREYDRKWRRAQRKPHAGTQKRVVVAGAPRILGLSPPAACSTRG